MLKLQWIGLITIHDYVLQVKIFDYKDGNYFIVRGYNNVSDFRDKRISW